MATPCLDCGDWIVVVFLFAFAASGAVYLFKHPSDMNFAAWLGLMTVAGGIFHGLRVHDQKVGDAQ